LPDNGAKSIGECQPDLRLYLYLIDSAQLIFNRIFDGDDLLARIVNLLQGAVESCRFAASRGSSHEYHAMRLKNHAVEVVEYIGGKSDGLELRENLPALEKPDDHALTVKRWNRSDTQIDVFSRQSDLDSAILRQPPFRDIELGEDLET
jgi:hypothetical protein